MKLNDYRYEYELLARFWTSIQAAVPILINLPSALVGAGGAGLMAAVGLAQSGLETPCISKLVRHYALVIQLFIEIFIYAASPLPSNIFYLT